MLRTNLSTRPFYNERAVHVAHRLASALSSLAITVAQRRPHRVAVAAQHGAVGAHRRRAGRGRRGSRRRRPRSARRSTRTSSSVVVGGRARGQRADRPAHVLVDRVLQPASSATLPPDVMLTSVRPIVQGRRDAGGDVGAGAARRGRRRVHGQARGDGRVRRRSFPRSRIGPKTGLYRALDRERLHRPDSRERADEAAPAAAAPAHRRAVVRSGRRSAASAVEGASDAPHDASSTEKRGLIWPIAIVLLVNVALFAAVVYPLSKKVAGGEQDAAGGGRRAERGAAGFRGGARDRDGQEPGGRGAREVLQRCAAARRERRAPHHVPAHRPAGARQCNLRLERQTSNPKPHARQQPGEVHLHGVAVRASTGTSGGSSTRSRRRRSSWSSRTCELTQSEDEADGLNVDVADRDVLPGRRRMETERSSRPAGRPRPWLIVALVAGGRAGRRRPVVAAAKSAAPAARPSKPRADAREGDAASSSRPIWTSGSRS